MPNGEIDSLLIHSGSVQHSFRALPSELPDSSLWESADFLPSELPGSLLSGADSSLCFFPGSVLHMSDVPGEGFFFDALSLWSGTLALGVCILVSCALVLLALPGLFNVLPFLLGGAVRWRETQHLADSPKLRSCCSEAALAMIFPTVFVIARFSLHPRCEGLGPWGSLAAAAVIFAGYVLLRAVMRLIMRPRKRSNSSAESFKFASIVPAMFFLLWSIILIITAFFGLSLRVPSYQLKEIMYAETALCYFLCILRRTQIFIYYRGFFSGILYLCTLEIIPTGALILSAIL